MTTPCLLNYAFSTAPVPLQVNRPDGQATSRINVYAANPGSAVYCSEIMVAVRTGTAADDFCLEAPTASVNTGKWTVSSRTVVEGLEIGLPPGAYAAIVFQCRDSADYLIDYSLVLSLVGVVNSAVGEFEYIIRETSGTTSDDLTQKDGSHTISKQDAIFTLSNFVATTADNPTVPQTAFANGQALRLSWESTGTWFELYAKGNPAPLYTGRETSFSIPAPPGLTADTQFVLVASVTGDPAGDSPSPGYQPIYLYDALTLVVTDPDLTPKSVVAQNGISAGGALAGGSLTVTGHSAMGPVTAASAVVTGHTAAAGGLEVGTASATSEANVHGRLAVTGAVSAGDLVLTGPARVGTTLVVSGKTTLADAAAVVVDVGTANANQANVNHLTVNQLTINHGGEVRNGTLTIEATGERNAAVAFNNSPKYCTVWFQNRARRTGNYISGLVVKVAEGGDYGVGTNGRITTDIGQAVLTHLPTRAGHRVVTSPLVPEAQVHLSGSANLIGGRARVQFRDDLADLLFHSSDAPYRVLATPTAQCAGLVVVEKAPEYFLVEEAAQGHSDVSFDWVVIARQQAAGDASAAMELPAELPRMQRVDTPFE